MIGAGSTLTASGSVGYAQTVAFAGGGLLALVPTLFSGQIDGLGGGGRIELKAHIEHGALHRMSAHATVPVPGQVRQTSGGTRHFDHDAVPVQPVEGITKVGATQGETASIRSGLQPGEIVVTDGVDKLQAGSKVRVQAQPAAAQASVVTQGNSQ